MTEKQARKLLEKPEFGNPRHIKALEFLRNLAEARELANKIVEFPHGCLLDEAFDELGFRME